MTQCSHCNKRKLPLIPFTCKCNSNLQLCTKCRMPEEHNCNYDFKTDARKKLEKENPPVIAKKMEVI
jgi:hypothetical protein